MWVRIDAPDDPRIKDYRDIRERDMVGRRGLFVAEGAVVIDAWLGRPSRHRPRSLLVSRSQSQRRAALLARVPEDVPVHVAPDAVLDAIAGFVVHRGLLAIGERAPDLSPEALLADMPARGRLLVAFGIANHDNMGGLFRNAAAFGCHGVILDRGCCDPLYRKAIRVSAGHALGVPFAVAPDADTALAALVALGIDILALAPAGRARLGDVRPAGRVALVVGTEGEGLAPALMDRLVSVRIEMPGAIDSLNVATSAAIALHHLAVQAA